MSAALRLMVRYLLWLMVLLLIGSLLIVVYRYVVGYEPADVSSGEFLADLLGAFRTVLLPVVLVTAGISLFDIIRESVDPRLGLPALFILWTGSLFGVAFLANADLGTVDPPSQAVPLQRVVRSGPIALYVVNDDPSRSSPVVVRDTDGFRLEPNVRVDSDAARLVTASDSVMLDSLSNTYASVVRPPRQIVDLDMDVARTLRFFRLSDGAPLALMHVGGMALFLLGMWTLVRLARWPLFNVVGVLLAIRFALWIVPAVNEGALRQLAVVALSSSVLPFLSAGLLGGVGVMLFLSAALLPPLQSFKRETAS